MVEVVPAPGLVVVEEGLPKVEEPKDEDPKDEDPKEEEPNAEEPAGVVVLLAGWPVAPVLPPPIVCMSEMGSYVNSHSL